MKRFEKFLFYYSILAVTVFFISFGIFSPKPMNFISGILLLPILFYFWIRLTNPQNASPGVWSARFLVSLVILCTLGVYGFYISKQSTDPNSIINSQLSEQTAQNEKLKSEVATLKEQLDKNEAVPTSTPEVSITDLITEPAPGNSVQRIMAKDGVEKVDVYANPSLTSQKVGTLEKNVNYPYITIEDGWYKIVVTSSTVGWVSSDQVEVSN